MYKNFASFSAFCKDTKSCFLNKLFNRKAENQHSLSLLSLSSLSLFSNDVILLKQSEHGRFTNKCTYKLICFYSTETVCFWKSKHCNCVHHICDACKWIIKKTIPQNMKGIQQYIKNFILIEQKSIFLIYLGKKALFYLSIILV